ncbi:hypothetical protein VT85_19885 [Planctomyces sp. SH-PL62]|nr:hypothetical protein [Planctomyces sp. SH-PL62]AMV39704.1 hypothetical protein VT85_19885 [Planctomyces sp. SH-PL62]
MHAPIISASGWNARPYRMVTGNIEKTAAAASAGFSPNRRSIKA